jgi:hypothetical protein
LSSNPNARIEEVSNGVFLWGNIMTIKSTVFAAALAATGIALSASGGFAAVNLITNGDFSAGLTDWSVVGSNSYNVDANGYHEGAFAGATGYLSQTFADSAGAPLTLTFNYQGTDSSSFQYVQFDGTTVAGSYVGGATSFSGYTFALGAGTGSDTITFVGQNQPSWNTLNNVSVTAVPEISTWAMMLAGFSALGFASYRRNKVASIAA